MKSKLAKLIAALSIKGVRLYTCKSCDPTRDAEQNLEGRTHYVTPSTRSYFKARILNAGESENGLVYWLIESVSSRPNAGRYTKRFVAFDVFGVIVSERTDADWHGSYKSAETAARIFLKEFDAVTHTREALKARATREIADARAALKTLGR